MRHDLTDTDVLTFALAGCNANEIGTYAGTSPAVAQARINRVLRDHCMPEKRDVLVIPATSRAPEFVA